LGPRADLTAQNAAFEVSSLTAAPNFPRNLRAQSISTYEHWRTLSAGLHRRARRAIFLDVDGGGDVDIACVFSALEDPKRALDFQHLGLASDLRCGKCERKFLAVEFASVDSGISRPVNP
jgi:hypothetical protein